MSSGACERDVADGTIITPISHNGALEIGQIGHANTCEKWPRLKTFKK